MVLLTVIGAVTKFAGNLLPEERLNVLQYEKSPFLFRGASQKVRWKLLEPESFAEARRTGRPVFLFIGVPWSGTARQIDTALFSDPETVIFLNSHFVCVRLDGERDPAWISTYLPLSRSARGMLPGAQIWLLAPDGRMIEPVEGLGTVLPIDPPTVIRELNAFVGRFDKFRSGDPAAEVPGVRQERDHQELLGQASYGPPAWEEQNDVLSRIPESIFGGFPVLDRVYLTPSAFRYLLRVGAYEAFRKRMDPLLRSPIVDWLDGGFFNYIEAQAPPAVDTNKVAATNAEMMAVLAQAYLAMGDPLYRRLALATFDSLAEEFQIGGFIATSRLSKPQKNGRSLRSSVPPYLMRRALTAEDREWARQELGLRVEENPQMLIWVKTPASALKDDARFNRVVSDLRDAVDQEKEFGTSKLLDVNGYVVARMLECARLMSDSQRMRLAEELYSRLDWFRAGDDVTRTIESGSGIEAYLGDYLAFADASLQYFFTTGDPNALDRGLRVLLRAKFLFESERPGLWYARMKELPQPGPVDVQSPEILDNFYESLSGQAIRLTGAYGRLLREPATKAGKGPSAVSVELSQEAISLVYQLGGLSDRFTLTGSGYFSASLGVLDDEYAVAVGPRSAELANELSRAVPTRVVAPAIGNVRRDLQSREPGIYVVSGHSTRGPLSVEEARRVLKVDYRPNRAVPPSE